MSTCRIAQNLVYMLILASSALAQETPAPAPGDPAAAADPAALAKAAQNPISSMISLPIQYNLNMGVERYEVNKNALVLRGLAGRYLGESPGPDGVLRLRNRAFREWFPGIEKHERTQNVVNIQPVYPVTVGDINIINRLIVPLIDQPLGDDDREFGLGDIQYSMYLSPAKAGKIIWGVGPTFTFPTATDDALGTGKWSAGPGLVALAMPGRWVVGGLLNNQWSFAGDDDRPSVNAMLFQPFINYNFKKGWYATSSPIITANWQADSDERWTVPVGAGVGRIFKVGKQPLNAQLGAYYNVEKPDGAPDWNIRFQLQFMFPK